MNICICITESFCCTLETNTTLLIKYNKIKKNFRCGKKTKKKNLKDRSEDRERKDRKRERRMYWGRESARAFASDLNL